MRIPSEIGLGILQNPVDVCVVPSASGENSKVRGVTESPTIVVADDVNGVFQFNAEGKLIKHIPECSDAGSVAYDPRSQQVVISVSKAASNGDTSVPCELWFYDRSLQKKTEVIAVPSEPAVAPKNIRWVAVDPRNGDVLVCSGHIDMAAIWKFSRTNQKWKTLLQRPGDLEHLCIANHPESSPADSLKVFLAEYTDEAFWNQKLLTFDADGKLKREEILVKYNAHGLQEPWSAVYDNIRDRIYIYDYQAPGNIFMAAQPKAAPQALVNTALGGGQWVSLKTWDAYLFASCSDDRCVRTFLVAD